MGAAAGKQFQSEKAKHAQAVLTAVEVFDESNQQPDDNNGGVSTEFFKKKVMLAATDAKRKGKDIEKSLAQLTDADLDMLAHYVGNRKDEERRLAGSNGANAMQVEEIADDGDNAADNIDETTSVLSYGDDEEEAADNDEMDSSGELIENIEEVVETRPRLNSGFKVFPMDGNEEAKNGAGEVSSSNSNQKSKLKLELDPPHSGIADHIAKFWDDELGSLASQATHGPGTESPTLSPTSTVIGKKFQPSPKQSFPYKDRGQRIDERNETLMVLQRQKVISLTQNAQLEREVEALQRQLEKMDQIDQTFESSRGLSGTNKSVNNSLNNTAGSSTSSKTVNGMQKYSYGHTDFTNSTGYGSGNLQAKYSYIYPIDEEISQSIDHSSSKDDAHTHLRKVGGERGSDAKVSAGGSGNHGSPAGVISGIGSSLAASRRNRRDRAAKGGSSPSSSDNDSTNSFGKIASKYRGGSLSSGGGGGGGGGGPIAAAQSKGGGIMRVKSNDPSDLSDGEAPSVPTQPSLGKVGKAHSSFIPVSGVPSSGGGVGGIGTGAGVGAGAGAGANPSRLPRRTGRGILSHDGGDSDDSAQHPRFGGAAAAQQSGYNPSHPSHHPSLRIAPKLSHQQAASDINDHQAKHGSVESDSESQHDGIRSGKNSQSTKAQNRRIVVANARAAAQGSVTLEEADSKRRDINAGTSSTATAHSHSSNVSPKLGRGRRLTSDDPKQVGSPARLAGEATASAVSELGDKKYQALLENVSLHLEAVGKEHPQKDIGAIADSAVVGSKAGFSRKGGALKKLNKRFVSKNFGQTIFLIYFTTM